MGMLECFEPSRVAWDVISALATAFFTLPEHAAVDAMRVLARPAQSDPAIVAGESGCVGLAGFIASVEDPIAREALRLGLGSRILVFNSEGATDPSLYQHYVGRTPQEVRP